MLAKINPTKTKSWQNLHRHYEKIKNVHMRDLFAQPALDHDHQRSLAVRMNYLKFRAARKRDELDRYEPRVRARRR